MIIPPYDERETIVPIIEDCIRVLKGYDFDIIVDSCTDRTFKTILETYSTVNCVKVLHRTEESGFITAIVPSFDRASNEVSVVLNGDFQHLLRRIPDFLPALDAGADLVVGTRYAAESPITGWLNTRAIFSCFISSLTSVWVPDARELSNLLSGCSTSIGRLLR